MNTNVRGIPESEYEALRALAERNKRSINSEILLAITARLTEQKEQV